jgi:tungsten cofactor oxidoreducase radical SAM maturase
MPKVLLEPSGVLRLPEAYLQRRGVDRRVECWLEQRGDTLTLLPRLPNLRRLYVEPTTVCNLHCRTCIRNVWDDPEAHMPLSTYRQLLEQTAALPDLERIVLSGFGEPLTHPDILEMVRLARERGLAVTLGSNGLLLDRAVSAELVSLGIDRLILSLDGAQADTYARVRDADIARVLANIRALNDVKHEKGSLYPALGIEFVALQSNVAELAELTALAPRLGAARVLVSNVLAYTEDMRSQVLYGYEPRPPFSAGGWPVKADAWVMWGILDLPRMHWGAEQRCRFVHDRAAVVGWDGGVAPCYALSHNYSYYAVDGRHKHVARYRLGDIHRHTLLEIWTSEDYCRFRDAVRDFRFPSCPDCDLRATCDLRAANDGCWGWNPSCADCLWAQDIVRCP